MNPILKYLRGFTGFRKEPQADLHFQGVEGQDLLQSLVEGKKIPGLAISVIKEGHVIFQKGLGFMDLERKTKVVPEKTLFRIASISKNIAAAALAKMVGEGLIDLDVSLYTYVPYFPKKAFDFTIRQLASHTAGIRGYKGLEYGLNLPYTIKESLEIFKEDDLLFPPGTDYCYTSYDWVLISLAMQEASGVPFEEYVRQKVLQPLGLKSTFAPAPYPAAAIADRKGQKHVESIFYSKNRSGFRKAKPVNNYYKLAGGGYLSTVNDIAKFGQAFLDKSVMEDDITSQFLRSQYINGKPTYYGLGWQVSKDTKGRSYFGHVGNGVGAYSNLFIYPKEQMVFAILTNCTKPNIQGELDGVVDSFFNYSQ